MHSFGPPFIWQWRVFLPNLKEFELCWTFKNIPKRDELDLKAYATENKTHIQSANLESESGFQPSGLSAFSQSPPIDLESAREVLAFFRLDSGADKATVSIIFEILTEDSLKPPGRMSSIQRSFRTTIPKPDVSWIDQCQTSRGNWSISGFPIEEQRIELIEKEFPIDVPELLIHIRTKKHVGPKWHQYEEYDGPAPGLMIWLQKRTNDAKQ